MASNIQYPSTPIDVLISRVKEKIENRQPIRLRLSGGGRLSIEQHVPFLCVYSEPAHGVSALRRWVTGELSVMILPAEPELQEWYKPLLRAIVEAQSKRFGAFFLLQLCLAVSPEEASVSTELVDEYKEVAAVVSHSLKGLKESPSPYFRVHSSSHTLKTSLAETLVQRLTQLRLMKKEAEVDIVPARRWSLLGLSSQDLRSLSCTGISVELEHPYIAGAHETAQWKELRPFFRGLMRVMKQAFFRFSRNHTPFEPPHYLALGRKAMVKAVRQVDAALARVNRTFEFLLYVTPVNDAVAWSAFQRSRYKKEPTFLYRPLGFEPHLLKRELYNIPVETIDDPTLAHLFLEKQEQLDRQITMLWDRNTPRFLYECLQFYGRVPETLQEEAKLLLNTLPTTTYKGKKIKPQEFVATARNEIEAYRERWPEFAAEAMVRSDVSGVLVSQGNLLVGEKAEIPVSRVEALLHHEVGTHCLTTANGNKQPLSLLGHGLAGYEGLQEGLAVMAEYLSGGLYAPRLRLLAGRVLAAASVEKGANFIETFQLLEQNHHFPKREAFTIAMRVHRGGGFLKDMVYLQGFLGLLRYLQQGGELEPLYVGKMGVSHIPLVRELLWRKVLQRPRLLPFFLEKPNVQERLQEIRDGKTLREMAEELVNASPS